MPKVQEMIADLRVGIHSLEDEDNPRMRRVLYLGLVSMLRTIGDVLGKHGNQFERQTYLKLKSSWNSEPKGRSVFRDFFNSERNDLVHE